MRIFLCLVSVSILALSYGKLQYANVTGQLVCGDQNVKHANITMWEKDTLDPDDKFDTVHSDYLGHFKVGMEESEITSIKPYIIVSHKCNAKHDNCHRESTFNVPAEYVYTKDKDPNGRPWHMGRVQLHVDAKDGDKRICK